MCKTILEYDCRHKTTSVSACQTYFQAVQRAQRETGFFRTLFCPPIPVRCPVPAGRRAVYRRCPACTEKDLQAELARRQKSHRAKRRREAELEDKRLQIAKSKEANTQMNTQVEASRKAHAENVKRKEKERQLKNRKLAFLCSACTAEGRVLDIRDREAIGYTCCARGVDEFAAWERAGFPPRHALPQPPSQSHTSKKRTADIPALLASGSKTKTSKSSKPKSIETIRRDARDAANSYGWGYGSRDSTALEPNLVRDFVNSSGADHSTLPRPPPRAVPHYQQLHIDKTRWNSYPVTNHGRLPGLGPQAYPYDTTAKPLPLRPLSTSKLIRKVTPLVISTAHGQPSSRKSRQNQGDVSPMTSPMRSTESLVSEMNNMLDAEMEVVKTSLLLSESRHSPASHQVGAILFGAMSREAGKLKI